MNIHEKNVLVYASYDGSTNDNLTIKDSSEQLSLPLTMPMRIYRLVQLYRLLGHLKVVIPVQNDIT